MRQSLRMLLLVGACLGPAVAWGCEFCGAPTLTLAEQLAQADSALLVKWVKGEPSGKAAVTVTAKKPDGSDDASVKEPAASEGAGTTIYEIVEVVRDPLKSFKAGATLTLPRYRSGKPGDLCLMFGAKGVSLEWTPMPITQAGYKYITQAPSPELPTPERLKYYINYLEHPDLGIAADAFGEFGNSKYEDILQVIGDFPHAKLRDWVVGPRPVESMRRGLYGLMLGLCGDGDDAQKMEAMILAPTTEFRMGLDGIMAGYLFLKKEAGLAVIETAKFKNPKETFSETFYGIQAVRFMWTHAKEKFTPERLRTSLRLLLDRPDIADLIIGDLARWKDWSSMDRLMKLYGTDDYSLPAFKRATVRFMLAASKDRLKDKTAAVPAHVTAAEKCLAELRTRDPKLVSDVEKFSLY